MSDVRVYLSLGVAGLEALARGGGVDVPASAVTAAWRGERPGDDEELEYEALRRAAERCAGRAVVGAADVPAGWVDDACGGGADPAAVVLNRAVPRGRVVSLHVALDAADELSWYDITELGEVVRLVLADPGGGPG